MARNDVNSSVAREGWSHSLSPLMSVRASNFALIYSICRRGTGILIGTSTASGNFSPNGTDMRAKNIPNSRTLCGKASWTQSSRLVGSQKRKCRSLTSWPPSRPRGTGRQRWCVGGVGELKHGEAGENVSWLEPLHPQSCFLAWAFVTHTRVRLIC